MLMHQIRQGIIVPVPGARGMIDSEDANAAWVPMHTPATSNPNLAARRHRVGIATTQKIKARTDQVKVAELQARHVERSDVTEAVQLVVTQCFAEIARLPDAGVADLAPELECEPATARQILEDARAAVMQELDGYEEELKRILAGL